MKKFVKYLSYILSFSLILSSLLITYFVSYPLFDVEVNELNKKEVIGLKPSVPIEFVENNSFWWLVRGENKLEFHNSSDETIKGNIILTIEPNPCNALEVVSLTSEQYSNEIVIKEIDETKIVVPIEIKNKSSVPIYLDFLNKKSCYVNNGDSRDFGAKLVFWSFE
ncbi:MAG: hypothetical protein RLZZ37_90 [Actinomycetota bacterium]|jgi:hypothetical protein